MSWIKNTLKTIAFVVSFGLLACFCALVVNGWKEVKPDYYTCITVDKPEKIQIALSNAMTHVMSKGFIICSVKIGKNNLKGTYTVKCAGIEEATLLKMEK